MKYLVFQSNLFFADQPDEQIDQWRLGGDCAGWLYAHLLPHEEIGYDCDPGMEDWGWYLAVEVVFVRVEMNLYHMQDHETGDYWVLVVSPKNKLFNKHSAASIEHAVDVVHQQLTQVVSSRLAFNRYAWIGQSPLDTDLSEICFDWIEAVERSNT